MTAAQVVDVDLFFQSMQLGTRELHVLVARPAGISYRSAGRRAVTTIVSSNAPRPCEYVPIAETR